ncbi:hypothetical protein [Halococcus saccharolyticus]|uniref:hypothetical protein n=1 Tax=Halococcus saccharolyticus TaxID=62319 RepID=UPI0013758AB4|nr:hypothetical protein [Halococcus saccharolyticus]
MVGDTHPAETVAGAVVGQAATMWVPTPREVSPVVIDGGRLGPTAAARGALIRLLAPALVTLGDEHAIRHPVEVRSGVAVAVEVLYIAVLVHAVTDGDRLAEIVAQAFQPDLGVLGGTYSPSLS